MKKSIYYYKFISHIYYKTHFKISSIETVTTINCDSFNQILLICSVILITEVISKYSLFFNDNTLNSFKKT